MAVQNAARGVRREGGLSRPEFTLLVKQKYCTVCMSSLKVCMGFKIKIKHAEGCLRQAKGHL